jgi:hypothetical protein
MKRSYFSTGYPKNTNPDQEAPVSIFIGQHVSNWLKLYIRGPFVESCRLIYVRVHSEGREGGGQSEGGGVSFLDPGSGPPLKNVLGHSYKTLNISAESLAQAQLIGTLFEQTGWKGGGLWTCPKVRGTRARVQAARRVKPLEQQFTPNF